MGRFFLWRSREVWVVVAAGLRWSVVAVVEVKCYRAQRAISILVDPVWRVWSPPCWIVPVLWESNGLSQKAEGQSEFIWLVSLGFLFLLVVFPVYFSMTDVALLVSTKLNVGWWNEISTTFQIQRMFSSETNCKAGRRRPRRAEVSSIPCSSSETPKPSADRKQLTESSREHRVSRSKQEALNSARGQFTAQTKPNGLA